MLNKYPIVCWWNHRLSQASQPKHYSTAQASQAQVAGARIILGYCPEPQTWAENLEEKQKKSEVGPFIYSIISMLFWAISREPNQGVRKQETMKPKRSVNTSIFGWWDGHLNSQPSHLLQVPSDYIYIYIIIYIWCVYIYIYTHGISVFGYLLAPQVAWNIFAIERATGLFRSTS